MNGLDAAEERKCTFWMGGSYSGTKEQREAVRGCEKQGLFGSLRCASGAAVSREGGSKAQLDRRELCKSRGGISDQSRVRQGRGNTGSLE